MVNWLYVLSSNVTMLGPILLYWVSILLIFVGWAVDWFKFLDVMGVIRLAMWIVFSFFMSYFQIAWIDEIQALYEGDRYTF